MWLRCYVAAAATARHRPFHFVQGKWYTTFRCVVGAQPLSATGQEGGVVIGLASLITTRDGAKIKHPARYRAAQHQLRVCLRRVARRKQGGKNRRKAAYLLQRWHAKGANQRKDDLNKRAYNLMQQCICVIQQTGWAQGLTFG